MSKELLPVDSIKRIINIQWMQFNWNKLIEKNSIVEELPLHNIIRQPEK